MHMSLLLAGVLSLATRGLSYPGYSPRSDAASSWPNAPFHTSGRDIKNTLDETVVYAGVNWPGAADVMIPEGLQYQSVADIVSKIKSLGMNVIRLTYAIEMIDDVYEGGDVSLQDATSIALGSENGTKVLNEILAANPTFSTNTTRLQVFDAVAEECYKQQIYVHLDNHVSKGIWCCSHDDGNSWFRATDLYFNVANWQRGLAYMADHIKSWPALTSMSLRNELRFTDVSDSANATYDWTTWHENVVPAANGINAANPDTLIFFSGLGYDTQMAPVVEASDLGNGSRFLLSDFSYADKIVFELHNYDSSATSCSQINSDLYDNGYNAMDTSNTSTAVNIAPVVLTEFGFMQDNSTYLKPYAQCIKEYLTGLDGGPGGWMQWDFSGSYYIREGTQDMDETWGLTTHDWSDWRSAAALDFTEVFVDETLG
ncbi:hypothetical protein AAFC00_003173 [Neodothiora populina]|uniref:Glycoside hydrolase family 5 domain-containing protein n=1 Tax=Neodothiora populina TaxID=2781224 RepID=A0ABR3PAV9_9PEZI